MILRGMYIMKSLMTNKIYCIIELKEALTLMTKNQYKEFFANVSKYLKISNILIEVNISRSAYAKFMQGQLGFMSLDTCKKLYDYICDIRFEKIA